ncbi:gfo/Idh/MocA family oxidoreductase [Pyrococcus furiosus DSM 3638]|uniref:Gfo/Idh/MocA family oxidoreductase n=3 Tax=Pyrococcus furiosus TaxID=2261 RepID=A0A5C0XPB5_PYRFU|nr:MULTISPECIES: Gfo/Idh/MocA family oxidoreductase [Pyrococcus]AAL80678.1 hypothetical protein PF0554 [Pyrococcus furiosus DSM 3638]AFN03351.1 hypothetical protein PFC_01900 [Pyrococcus furiosus COM1]MDK2869426.1 hypothetical protein [Pyrococcus sp.]QEK78265.1 gfo/Idh/MocA family oxidoreductase [Pyrococcus furiosus DSM 3638]
MRKVKLGLVGCGIAAKTLHIPALKKLSELFEVTAVTSRTRAHAQECSKLLGGVEVFESYDELLKSGEVDAVDLALPVELNLPFIKKAVESGVHVICEKPISTDTKTGKEIVKIAESSDVVVYIAENFRHIPVFWKAKELIEKGKIGDPIFMSWHIWVGMDESNPYVHTEWRKKPKHIGGYLSDGGVHHVAAMRLIFGDIVWVSAVVRDISPLLGGPDFISSILEFESGVVGSYTAGYPIKGKDRFEVVGTEGRMVIEWDRIVLNGESIYVKPEDSYKLEFKDFYYVVKGKRENVLGSPLEALKDLAVIEAAVNSNGQKVNVGDLLDLEK